MKIAIIYILSIVYLFLSLQMERGTGVYIIISVALLLWGYIEKKSEASRREAEIRRLSELSLQRIPYTQRLVSPDYLQALLIDEDTSTLYLANREPTENEYEIKEYPFYKIIESAIIEDGVTVSLYPKDGILMSSLPNTEEGSEDDSVDSDEEMDKEEETDEEDELETKLSLKFVFDDLTKPINEYVFIEGEDPDFKESDEYKEASDLCKEWHQKISVIIKRCEHKKVLVSRWY